jgi:thiamine-phosphate pyrophosphorylase
MKEPFGLYLILTNPVAGYEACAQAAVDSDVRYLQLRMKNAKPEALLSTARALQSITRGSSTRLIINDHLSVAIKSNADGIHLGQDDLPLSEARARWNVPKKIFGLSTHSLEQAIQSVELLPDYIGVGPVFSTPTKANAGPALGIEEAARIARAARVPSVAIGGINTKNLPTLLDAGIENFCVVRAVNEAADPAVAIRNLQDIWQEALKKWADTTTP